MDRTASAQALAVFFLPEQFLEKPRTERKKT